MSVHRPRHLLRPRPAVLLPLGLLLATVSACRPAEPTEKTPAPATPETTSAAQGAAWTYGSSANGPTASIPSSEPGGATLVFETGGVGSRARLTLPAGAATCPGETRTVIASVPGRGDTSSRGAEVDLGTGGITVVVSPVAPLWEAVQGATTLSVSTGCPGSAERFIFPVAGLDSARMPGFPEP